jgi:hypothetical protein
MVGRLPSVPFVQRCDVVVAWWAMGKAQPDNFPDRARLLIEQVIASWPIEKRPKFEGDDDPLTRVVADLIRELDRIRDYCERVEDQQGGW